MKRVLAGHYNPFREYPSPVIPIYLDYRCKAVAAYRSSSQVLPESVKYVPHHDTLRAELAEYDLDRSLLFAYSEEKVAVVDRNEEPEFFRGLFVSGALDDANPFIMAPFAVETEDEGIIRRVSRACLLELGAEPDEFVLSWYASLRKRSEVTQRLPPDAIALLKGSTVLRIGSSPDKELVFRRLARTFNNNAEFEASSHLVWIAPSVDESFEPSDSLLYQQLDVLLPDPMLAPLVKWYQKPKRSFAIGMGELVLGLSPSFADRLGSEGGWIEALKLAATSHLFSWIRPRSGTPLGSLLDLGLQRALGLLSNALGQPHRWLIGSLERNAQYSSTDTEAVAGAFSDGVWHVDAIVAQRHSLLSAFSGVAMSLRPKLLAIDEADLLLKHEAFLLQEGVHIRRAFDFLCEFLASDRGQAVLSHGGMQTKIPAAAVTRALEEKALLASREMSFLQRPVAVCLVIDVSGSMRGAKLDGAKVGALAFLGRLNAARGDAVGLNTFANKVDPTVAVGPLVENGDEVGLRINALESGGGTALMDAIMGAMVMMDGWEESLRAVVVLTDGRDNSSVLSEDEVLSAAARRGERGNVRIFSLAYGEDADYNLLQRISEATGGSVYRGGVATIEALFAKIAYGL